MGASQKGLYVGFRVWIRDFDRRFRVQGFMFSESNLEICGVLNGVSIFDRDPVTGLGPKVSSFTS